MADALEDRVMLSASSVAKPAVIAGKATPGGAQSQGAVTPDTGPEAQPPYTPTQMQTAYGVNLISFDDVAGTGAGQTIAIVDAYNDPNIISDTNFFSAYYGLPQFNAGNGGPTLTVLNENGGTTLPADAPPDSWAQEESLDVQWAHAIAPQANIILYEAAPSVTDLLTAEVTAAANPVVSVVSNSWRTTETSEELSWDSDFLTPAGHQGVTFLASAGDAGSPSHYPAYSPNVVAVGGTSLYLQQDGTYISETAWNDGNGEATGGGISKYEPLPSYQEGIVDDNGASATNRNVPDVAMDADPNTDVAVYDSYDYSNGWTVGDGTSLATPMWAGLIAIADQLRFWDGQSTLNGLVQTLPTLYSLPSSDFHDITTGGNGTYNAGPGYDLVSGLGTPVANLLVPDLGTSLIGDQPPTVNAPSTAATNENIPLVLSGSDGISVTDPNSVSITVDSLSLSVQDGTLTLSSTTGLSFTSGSNDSASMTVSGTLSSLDAALASVIYTPTFLYHGPDSLAVSITDPVDNLSASATVALTVVQPPPPAITAPTSASLYENSSLIFSGASAIAVADSESSSSSDSLMLSVTNGTLTLASTTGLTFTSGANGSASMTVTGTVSNLDAALADLEYTPTTLYVGSDSLLISVSDPLDAESSSATVPLTVIELPAPTITAPTVPGSVGLPEDGSMVFSGSTAISVADSAAGNNSDSLALSVSDGTVTFAGSTTGLTFTAGANGSASMTVTGTISNLNAALTGLEYIPTTGFYGTDSLTLQITNPGDLESASATVSILVVERPPTEPVITGPSTAYALENGTLDFSGSNLISIADSVATGNAEQLYLTATFGTITLASTSGLTFVDGSNDGPYLGVDGSLTSLNAALDGLVYQPNTKFYGTSSLVIEYLDSGDGLWVESTVQITVLTLSQAAPTITAPATAATDENTPLAFSGSADVSVTDPIAGNGSDSLTLSVNQGTLMLGSTSGLSYTSGSNGSDSMTVTGTVNELNAALAGLTYAPTNGYSGSDSLAISISDPILGLSASSTVALTINPLEPPTITAPSSVIGSENTAIVFSGSTAISLADIDALDNSDSLTLSVGEGVLTLGSTSGLTFTSGANDSASMTVAGTLANLNAALAGFTYTPNSLYVGSDSLGILVTDPETTLSASAKVGLTLDVLPAPTITAPSTAGLAEDGSMVFSGSTAISVADPSAGNNSDSLALSVGEGTVTFAGSTTGLTFTAGANGSGSMTVTGTISNLNAALTGLKYAPTTGYSGSDSLNIAITDPGDNESASATVSILIVPLGSEPRITAPATATDLENATLTFSGSNLISITDPNATSNSERLTITATFGTVTLATTSGITFVSGSNQSATMSVTGSLASLNAAINGVAYKPNSGFIGTASLILTYSDVGDGMTATGTVQITVTKPKSGGGLGPGALVGSDPVSAPVRSSPLVATSANDAVDTDFNPPDKISIAPVASESAARSTALAERTSAAGRVDPPVSPAILVGSLSVKGAGPDAISDVTTLWEGLKAAVSVLSG